MSKTREELALQGWTGGHCERCGHYAAWLHWRVCPRCRRTKAGRKLAAENAKRLKDSEQADD